MSFEKLKLIADGWKNVIFESPTVEKLAKGRAEICSKCPYAEKRSWLEAIGAVCERVKGVQCSRCGCPISAKTRSVAEVCPEGKW